ncbi:MAG: ROK family protein [Flammeovirgaceae bacterium]|jgi:polyphosphate glucokinase|nr:ROK family protein [Flammeovirgaceae bacterium]|tara:strand:- start:4243 stop:4986 length:744 start_codon:yes stop_codon:yes gene_type:complete
MNVLGIDVGGTGIKGGVVDVLTGKLITERKRFDTPIPSSPENVINTILQLIKFFNWEHQIGCGFPSVIQNGIVKTASNIDKNWIGLNPGLLLSKATGCKVQVLNDVDSAGYAEIKFGAGAGQAGNIIVLAAGTGIGSAIFRDQVLYPNSELGFVKVKGKFGEHYASNAVREEENLSWAQWGDRFSQYLIKLENLLWPDLFILGGGVSKKFNEYENFFTCRTPIVPAQFENNAGIIGAALASKDYFNI